MSQGAFQVYNFWTGIIIFLCIVRYLDWAVSENSGIRKQDAARVFSAIASNSVGQPLAYSFLRNKWDHIRE
jgi:TM2 domain-containing membrane protein YozV